MDGGAPLTTREAVIAMASHLGQLAGAVVELQNAVVTLQGAVLAASRGDMETARNDHLVAGSAVQRSAAVTSETFEAMVSLLRGLGAGDA